MSESVNIRISGRLKKFIAQQIGIDGLYESASEYVRDLIRKDYELQEKSKWHWLHEQLKDGLNADENDFIPFNPTEIINQAQKENY